MVKLITLIILIILPTIDHFIEDYITIRKGAGDNDKRQDLVTAFIIAVLGSLAYHGLYPEVEFIPVFIASISFHLMAFDYLTAWLSMGRDPWYLGAGPWDQFLSKKLSNEWIFILKLSQFIITIILLWKSY